MLDEPLGALDRALRDRLVTELRALFTRLGLSILFVTHDHGEAFALADRLIVMHEGRIEQEGAPSDVWRRPANGFVARFLGWNVTSAFGSSGHLVAVRPDDLRIVDQVPGAGSGVRGRVTARTFHGERYLLDVTVDGHGTLRVGLPVTTTVVPDPGTDVGVTPAPGTTVDLPDSIAPDGSLLREAADLLVRPAQSHAEVPHQVERELLGDPGMLERQAPEVGDGEPGDDRVDLGHDVGGAAGLVEQRHLTERDPGPECGQPAFAAVLHLQADPHPAAEEEVRPRRTRRPRR